MNSMHILAAAIVALVPAIAAAETPINQTHAFDARGRVEVENVKGRIEVRAWNRNEVRIEGHTSSQWTNGVNPEDAYFRNMELSQARTRSVLLFVQGLKSTSEDQAWVRRNVAAVGLSSSRLVLDDQGKEDAERSRRVTFRVISNAETQIRKLIQD